MAGKDGQGAVDLLGEYHAGKLMWQGNSAQGKQKVGALPSGSRPPVCRSNGEDEALGAVVAKAAELSSELFGRVLHSAAIQQNRVRRCAPLLAFKPIEKGSLRVEDLRAAGDMASRPPNIVVNQAITSLRFGPATARADGGKSNFHCIGVALIIFIPITTNDLGVYVRSPTHKFQ
jgi:hypothetical protein